MKKLLAVLGLVGFLTGGVGTAQALEVSLTMVDAGIVPGSDMTRLFRA